MSLTLSTLEFAGTRNAFLDDVIAGLGRPRKSIPPKYFYDERGSKLFEQITQTPEYYVTRTEIAILRRFASEIAELCRGRTALVEFGSGNSIKARILLEASPWIETYAPCDISAESTAQETARLARDLPAVKTVPVIGDFAAVIDLPDLIPREQTAALFLGSTIGNFTPADAKALLANFGAILGGEALLFVGVDLVKDTSVLDRAYNDAAGVTAAFNLNLLRRINRELGGDFDLDQFAHRAFFNARQSRIEMHLVSRRAQCVHIGGRSFSFCAGETIHTENSYKYTVPSFVELARAAGWRPLMTWTDAAPAFCVHALAR